ncbi:MAG: retron Ec67 family RNA-directed DNA polymerase/endonuclease [Candidatus Thiodiazotropha endolucinida]
MSLTFLKKTTSVSDFATLLGYKPKTLAYILYAKPIASRYTDIEINKKNGGTRTISIPDDRLKLVQRRLSSLLLDCVDEIFMSTELHDGTRRPDRIAHGFKRNRSIITNARQHKNKRYVFNLDLKDFFPSINFGRIRGFFIENKHFQLSPKTATILAQIACYNNALPQGSPCSPVVSNLIGHILDIRINSLARNVRCAYSRYADDLTFSTNLKVFPKDIAVQVSGDDHNWDAGNKLKRIIERSGFSINKKKTRMQYMTSRQEVTGLTVNKRINTSKSYRKNVRAMVHRVVKTGQFQIMTEGEEQEGKLTQLHGMLGFIYHVDFVNSILQKVPEKEFKPSIESVYRQFLIYKFFYATEAPILLCEGKTDNVYITHAIRQLASSYPTIAEVKSEGKITIKVRQFRYTNTTTSRILKLRGGTGNLKDFINNYKHAIKKFSAPGMKHPIIILVDNDDGANSILSIAKQITKKQQDRNSEFIHLINNLYVILTPLAGTSEQSKIEDCFSARTLNIPLKGKIFTTNNEYDNTTHYGKSHFAYQIVEKHADKIDFSGFKPILDRIMAVIEHYNLSIATNQ